MRHDLIFFVIQAYTKPELLGFAWLRNPSNLQSSAMKEYNTNGSFNLRVKTALPKIQKKKKFCSLLGKTECVCVCTQVFELPKLMMLECKELSYHYGNFVWLCVHTYDLMTPYSTFEFLNLIGQKVFILMFYNGTPWT